jgi:hypothetical protein
MSFDLAVWYEPAIVTAEEAARKYERILEREPGTVVADPRAAGFHRELIARYPNLSDLTVDEFEDSPWAMDPSVVVDAVILSMSWSMAEPALPYIRELAERHELVCYDPQSGAVYSPPSLRGDSMVVLSSADGSRVENPGAAQIEAVLERLSPKNWFAILDRGDHYVQVGFGERAATRSGWFALEHREGLPDRHFRVEIPDRARVVRAFTGFAAGDGTWHQGFDWHRMKF